MLKDELKTKEQIYKEYEEFFNKVWYGGLKEIIFDDIKNKLPNDGTIIHFDFDNYIYTYRCNNNPDIYYNDHIKVIYFIKSKLWNEGINLLINEQGKIFMKIREKNEKYKDMFIVNKSPELNICVENLIIISWFAKMSIDEVENIFRDLHMKQKYGIQEITVNNYVGNNPKNIKPAKKKLKGNNIKNFDNDGDEIIKELKKSQDNEKEILKEF